MTGRLWAAGQLSEYSGNLKTVESWKKIATEYEFWAVRAAAIEQIGKFYAAENIDLIKNAAREESSKVRAAAIKALGELKDPSLKNLFKQTFKTDNSYAVKSETLIAIGKCGNKSDISFLKEAGLQKSYRDVVSNAAKKAIVLISGNK